MSRLDSHNLSSLRVTIGQVWLGLSQIFLSASLCDLDKKLSQSQYCQPDHILVWSTLPARQLHSTPVDGPLLQLYWSFVLD